MEPLYVLTELNFDQVRGMWRIWEYKYYVRERWIYSVGRNFSWIFQILGHVSKALQHENNELPKPSTILINHSNRPIQIR